jgi:hypothetical protein
MRLREASRVTSPVSSECESVVRDGKLGRMALQVDLESSSVSRFTTLGGFQFLVSHNKPQGASPAFSAVPPPGSKPSRSEKRPAAQSRSRSQSQ